MNKGLLVLNVILLIAVSVLFYLQLKPKKPNSSDSPTNSSVPDTKNNSCHIAYFEMDSVEKNYEMVKEVRVELNKRQDGMNAELDKMGKEYQDKYNEYQGKSASMSPTQTQMAMQDLKNLSDKLSARKQSLEQDYSEVVTRKMTEVKNKIEEFLKVYNQDKRYDYIIVYEPGLFYYRNTAYNITNDVIAGLNAVYKQNSK